MSGNLNAARREVFLWWGGTARPPDFVDQLALALVSRPETVARKLFPIGSPVVERTRWA